MNIFNDIAREINRNAKNINTNSNKSIIELGKITPNGLKLNNFKYEIKDYKKLHHLETPEVLLGDGDTVLVATFENECVVIGKVV